jgi:hypothetical protein
MTKQSTESSAFIVNMPKFRMANDEMLKFWYSPSAAPEVDWLTTPSSAIVMQLHLSHYPGV